MPASLHAIDYCQLLEHTSGNAQRELRGKVDRKNNTGCHDEEPSGERNYYSCGKIRPPSPSKPNGNRNDYEQGPNKYHCKNTNAHQDHDTCDAPEVWLDEPVALGNRRCMAEMYARNCIYRCARR